MVPDNSTGIPRVPAYSGAAPVPSRFRVRGSHPLWPGVPAGSARFRFAWRRSYNPGTCLATPPVWALPRSLAATGGIVLTFSSCGYLDVSVPRVRSAFCGDGIAPAGLPHSEIRGSRDICSSPRLFAACHVLLRLREPRHPPCALVVPFISFINRT